MKRFLAGAIIVLPLAALIYCAATYQNFGLVVIGAIIVALLGFLCWILGGWIED